MELADRLQLSKSAISAYEQDRKVPSLDTVIQLATYFDVSVDYLLGIEIEITSTPQYIMYRGVVS